MRTGSKLFLLIVMAACLLTGCGLDDDNETEAGYENALYMAYATTKSGETMYIITTTDPMRVVYDITEMIQDYANDYGFSSDATIALSSPPSGWDTVPAGMRGTITIDTTGNVTMDITLSDCEVASSRYYSGSLTVEGILDSNYAVSSVTVTATNLEIEYDITDYETVRFSDYDLTVNKTGTYTAYTYDGSFTYGNTDYGYSSFRVQQSDSTTKTASGKVIIEGSYYGISATVTIDSSGYWTSGSTTITDQDSDGTINETMVVTLSGTTASFQITDGDSWELTDWYSEQLVP